MFQGENFPQLQQQSIQLQIPITSQKNPSNQIRPIESLFLSASDRQEAFTAIELGHFQVEPFSLRFLSILFQIPSQLL